MKLLRLLSNHESATLIVWIQLFTQSSKHEIHSLKPNPMHQLFNKNGVFIFFISFLDIYRSTHLCDKTKKPRTALRKGPINWWANEPDKDFDHLTFKD